MAIILPGGFNITNNEPVDARITVADQTARLAFSSANVYEGLVVYQQDTNELYVLIDTSLWNSNSGWQLVGSGGGSTFPYTGSAIISGSLNVIGSITGSDGIINQLTASYAVTASYVENVTSASYATTASYVENTISASYATTASYTENANSSSYAVTASYVENVTSASYATTASYVENAQTASYVENATSASYATTASYVENTTSASYAITASYVENVNSASYATTASYVENSQTASFVTASNVYGPYGSNSVITASYAVTASYVESASYSATASYAENANITYVSSSNFNLNSIQVQDFDTNVAVTFDSGSGLLTFIFGLPATQSISSFTDGGTFLVNRFNTETDNYTVTGTWANNGYTLTSAKILTGSTELTNTTSGTSLNTNLTTSGSQQYILHVSASSPLDSSEIIKTSTLNLILSKTAPGTPTQAPTATIQLGASSNQIEQGATGSISLTSSTGSANNWTILAFSGTSSFGATTLTQFSNIDGSQGVSTFLVTGSATGSNSIVFTTNALYNSNGLNSPEITNTQTDTDTFTKIRSIRGGASANTSFTAAELENLASWDTTLGGTIGTIYKGTTNPSGNSVTFTWTGDKYHYIVYNSSLGNLTNITTSGFGVLSQFNAVATVGNYKVYRTTTLQAGGAGTSITYTLTI